VPRSPPDGTAVPPSVRVFVLGLSAAAVWIAVAVAPLPAPLDPVWVALPALALLLVAATWFVVPFRYGDSVDASNLVEAALVPLLVAYPPLVVVLVAALSQVANGLLRQLSWVKTLFNTAMWALAAGTAGAVLAAFGPGPVWPHRIVGLLTALLVVGLVNAAALGIVLALLPERPRRPPGTFTQTLKLSWLAGWIVNVAVGLLFALAYLASPVAVALFGVPLLVLHLAYRSYTMARADQALLSAVHRAARRLTEPLQPVAAVPDFLRELATCFDASAAELVLRVDDGRQIHRFDRSTEAYTVRSESGDIASLAGILAASARPVRVSAGASDAVAGALASTGASNCLAAPLLDAGRLAGVVVVLDRGGFQGSRTGEIAVLEALARETTAALAKGRLVADVFEERRKLAEIVGSTSDGICSFAGDGTVRTWNPALERITGLRAAQAIGRSDVVEKLRMRTVNDQTVTLRNRPITSLPAEIRLTATDGTSRHLTCSYSVGDPQAGAGDREADAASAALIVVARDVTPVEEHAALREQFDLLMEADEARRVTVEQLQQAVMPAPLVVTGAEIAAAYESSDPSAPTGGDLYDWQELASGEVHVAVVDVLGHGVAATKDALAVVHTLRVVTASDTPLLEVVGRADELLRAQHPELVATVLVARYSPGTGALRVVAGGHPPALVVTPRGEVTQLTASGGVIGWPNAGSDDVFETVLLPGDALVMYTDGLVEARKNILDGMDALERHAADVADLPAEEFARELMARALAGADRKDDALALVLRRDVIDLDADRRTWEFAPDTAQVSATRNALLHWLHGKGVEAYDATLVAGELLANAARSARSRIVLQVEVVGATVVVDVSDDGIGSPDLAGQGVTSAGTDAEGGRGLFVVRALCDRIDVLSTTEGSTVRAVLPRLLDAAESLNGGEPGSPAGVPA
jgi:PAS domain S-box-containing protein